MTDDNIITIFLELDLGEENQMQGGHGEHLTKDAATA